MRQDKLEKLRSEKKTDIYYKEDTSDPIYRKGNGQHSRTTAKSISKRKKRLHRHQRRVSKQEIEKYNKEE